MASFDTKMIFPGISLPFVDVETGVINQIWLAFLQALWNRTGGGPGGSITDALLVSGLTTQIEQSDQLAMVSLMAALSASADIGADGNDCCVTVIEIGTTYMITNEACGTTFVAI